MKNSFRKLIPVAAALGLVFAASSAQAFTLKNGTGTTYATGVTSLDWNSTGSGVAKNVANGVALTQGKQFDFLYQANLSSVAGKTTGTFRGNLDATADGAPNDADAFEFTIVAKLSEYVRTSSVDLVNGTVSATFGLNNTVGANKVAIYYDTKANAFTSTGTGFDDGIMVALLTVDPNVTLSTLVSARARTCRSRTSPLTNSASPGMARPRVPWTCSIRLSSTRTRWPRCTSARTTCRPMNPAPPVTRTRSAISHVPSRSLLGNDEANSEAQR